MITHSLEDYEIDHIFMNNPVWNKPLIKLSDVAYFWPLVHVFQSFGLEMLSDLYSPKELDNFEMKVKPQFCENKVVELFKKYFPCAKVISNNYYVEDGKRYVMKMIVV